MNYDLEFSKEFLADIKRHQKSRNKHLLKKIDTLLSDIRMTPKLGEGKREQLEYMSAQIWSRRINKQHRLTYEIKGETVEILTDWGHYDDK